MRFLLLLLFVVAVTAVAGPAFAQTTNPYDVSWSALDPGNDWAAQVVASLFPAGGTLGTTTTATSTGSEATVIGQIVGQFTGFVAAIACAFVCYNTIMTIHRAAESSQILGNNQSWIFVVRVGFAAIMMFPLGSGFSAGQQLVEQAALWGVGMGKALYTNAMQAVGPDAMIIAQPVIPGTGDVISGLINSELCMDLVNLAGGSANPGGQNLITAPSPVSGSDLTDGSYVSWRYSLSSGNESGNPACGSVSIDEPPKNQTTVAGINVNMAGVQQAILQDVLNIDIRAPVEVMATELYNNKDSSVLASLQSIYKTAVNDYTQELETTATSEQSAINNAIHGNLTAARKGNLDLLTAQHLRPPPGTGED